MLSEDSHNSPRNSLNTISFDCNKQFPYHFSVSLVIIPIIKDITMYRTFLFLMMVSLALIGCTKKQSEPPQEMQSQQQGEMPEGHPDISAMSAPNAVAGVRWTMPSRWSEGPPKQMRVATYNIPAASGDAEGGECAVFYFGSGQGGDVESNIQRWVGQFVEAGKPKRSSKEVNGMKVELVEVAGTYTAPSGPMMQASGNKENYRLLGAIVAAPEGSVFFKFTGPAKTVGAAEKDFNALIASLTK